MAQTLLSQFDRVDLVYKSVDDTRIEAAVLIPKAVSPSSPKSHPILVHFHGGALVVGTNPDPSFLARWCDPHVFGSYSSHTDGPSKKGN